MGYRIIEMSRRSNHSVDGAVEVGVYDSAYHAMSAMKRAFQEQGKLHWYLVDSSGQVLAYPEDVYEAV
jgi:mannose/cellobiose epimerase-like protein (N-acyl-D-glucosamine 2-epimerase family)